MLVLFSQGLFFFSSSRACRRRLYNRTCFFFFGRPVIFCLILSLIDEAGYLSFILKKNTVGTDQRMVELLMEL